MMRARSSIRSDDHGRHASAWIQVTIAGGFLLLAVLLGGASAAGPDANAVIQLTGVIAIAAMCVTRRSAFNRAERQVAWLAAAFAALFVLQVIPLPVVVWLALPGRHYVADGLHILGIAPGWMPLSLAPAQTVGSALGMLPAVAMLTMIAGMQRVVAGRTLVVLIGASIVSLLIGVAQAAGVQALYFYENTNIGSAVGFFANANHFGTLMCVTMPLAAGVAARLRVDEGKSRVPKSVMLAGVLGVILLCLLGIVMTQSVAAVMLAVFAVVASVLVVLPGVSRRLQTGFLLGILLAILVAMTIAFTDGASGLVSTTIDAKETLGRPHIWRTTWSAISQFGLPGSGFGTFQRVYHLFENAGQTDTIFVNHAHNDLLEFVLEGGLPAAILLVLFLAWFLVQVRAIWLGAGQRDPLAQGASIAATIILLHSLVDYPLRTGALATVFGLCIALMARDVRGRESSDPAAAAPAARHLSV